MRPSPDEIRAVADATRAGDVTWKTVGGSWFYWPGDGTKWQLVYSTFSGSALYVTYHGGPYGSWSCLPVLGISRTARAVNYLTDAINSRYTDGR